MGVSEVFGEHQTRESPGEIYVDIASGRRASKELPRKSQTEIADSLYCLNGNGNYLSNPGEKLEESNGLLNPQATGLTNTDHSPQEMPNFVAESSFDVRLLKATFEGILNVRSEATKKSNAVLQAVFEKYELELRKLREVMITERDSRSTQLIVFQDTIRIMKHEIGELREVVKNVPAICEDDLANIIEIATGKLFRHGRHLDKDLRDCRTQLESATKDIRIKTGECEKLTADIASLEQANSRQLQRIEMIQEELCKEKEGLYGSYIDGSLTPYVLESAAKEMFSSIGTYSSLLSKYKDSKGDNPAKSLILASELWRIASVPRTHHWTYLLKNWICNLLFRDFEYGTFVRSDPRVLFLDQDERSRKCFEYFQNSKGFPERATAPGKIDDPILNFLFYEYFSNMIGLLPPEIQHLALACRDYRELMGTVRNKIQESEIDANNRRLMASFIIAAKKAFNFHKLCLSFDPPATIFRVSRGDLFNASYMESIDTVDNKTVPTVSFMVYPGFRLRKSIIKCQVYLMVNS